MLCIPSVYCQIGIDIVTSALFARSSLRISIREDPRMIGPAGMARVQTGKEPLQPPTPGILTWHNFRERGRHGDRE